jgi:hypothetical protein
MCPFIALIASLIYRCFYAVVVNRVQLKATIVVPTAGQQTDSASVNVLFSAFIEPKASANMGG